VKSAFDDEEGVKIPFPQREVSGRAETGGFRVRATPRKRRGRTRTRSRKWTRRNPRMTDLADRRGAETEVYQPAEDSLLLAEAAVDDVDARARVLEVGTGSGYVAATVADETGASVVGSDLNPFACRQAFDRGVPVVRADLLSAFRDDAFDAVLFNPPYLPGTMPPSATTGWRSRCRAARAVARSSNRSSTRSAACSPPAAWFCCS